MIPTGIQEVTSVTPADLGRRLRPRVFLMVESLQTGGTERQYAVAARELRAEFDIVLGCSALKGQYVQDVGRVTEFDTGTSMLSRRAWMAGKALAGFLREQRIDIAHSFDWYGNMLLIPAARAARVPVVIGSHRQTGDVFSRAHRVAQSIMFRFADRIVCNCEAAAQRLISHGISRHKLIVLPNLIPNELFADCEPALPLAPGVLRVGMVGRMNNPVKNFPLLLRAGARLQQRFPSLELVLVGEGNLRPGLEQLARELGIAQRVRFLGERRDVPAVLRSLDVVALTSDTEGLSNAILEAMAAGKPVVATRVGGNPELVQDGETGLLFPVRSELGLATALERLLLDPELRRAMGVKAQAQARTKYGIESVIAQVRQLYLLTLEAKQRLRAPAR